MRFSIGGRFKVWKGLPGKLELITEFHNHVTDYGLDKIASKSIADLMYRLYVGSGSTAPADSDIALESVVASTTTTTTDSLVYSNSEGYAGLKKKFSFSAGAAEGTLTELGLSDGTSLFNRQLFTDYAGETTSIVVSSDEVLEILCEVRVYTSNGINVKSNNNNFIIGSDSYTCNFSTASYFYSGHKTDGLFPYKALNYLNSTGWWSIYKSTTNYSAGDSGIISGISPNSVSLDSYVAGSFQLNFTLTWNTGTYTYGNVNLLLGSHYSLFPNIMKKFFEMGISSPYNQYQETPWVASTAYLETEMFISALGDSYIYKVTVAGTSHTIAPTWPTTVGDTVTDGNGVEYECVGALLRVETSEALTLNVNVSWGRET